MASSPLVDHDLWEEFKEAIAENWGNYRYQRSVLLCFRACKALYYRSDGRFWNELSVALNCSVGIFFQFQCFFHRDRSGNPLRVRPHWAKEFPRSVGGVPINDYMRQIYSTQLPAYVQGMRKLVEEKNDGDLSSTLAMFNTKYMENILNGYL